jgi:hypothetical protein
MGAKLKALFSHPGYLLGIFASILAALVSTQIIPTSGTLHNIVAGILAGLAAAGVTSAGMWTPPATGTSTANSSAPSDRK